MLDLAGYLHSRCFCSWFEAIRAVVPAGFFYFLKSNWELCLQKEVELSFCERVFVEQLKKYSTKVALNAALKKIILNGSHKKIIESLKEKKVLNLNNNFKRKIADKNISVVRVIKKDAKSFKLTKKQKIVYDYVKKVGEATLKQILYFCAVSGVVVKNLEKLGVVEIFEKPFYKSIFDNIITTKEVDDIILNEEQQAAKNGICSLIDLGIFSVALLKGVTGSGKTQVFLKLIDYVVKKGKDVIVMVPEISLTVQTVSFFKAFFGDKVALFHSALGDTNKFYEYKKILSGKAKLVVGTRSAVFAPCKNLGLIIMDEEGGACYKSSDMSPRYDARDVAKYRCFKNSAVLLLASATPSVETNYFAKRGLYKEFLLKHRYKNIKLPKVFLVDISKAKMSRVDGVSLYLFNELVNNFKKKEQSIIFLNRRGYFLTAVCLDCRNGVSCKNCSALMVYHKVNNCFVCHYCGFVRKNIESCSFCGSKRISFCGQGTQNIELNIKKNIKGAKVLRLDSDSIFSRVDLEEKIRKFENREYDILVGTQIVAKGLNFLNVSLVGVVGVDEILYGSDFKSNERAFSILTQVVGRSGRSFKVGRAIIQTINPSNKIICWAAKQDYDLFYENEIIERKAFFCPPFCDIFIVNFIGEDKDKLILCAKEFITECRKRADENIPFKLLGISTPYIELLNRKYRKRIIIKCRNSKKFREWIRNVAVKVFSSKSFLKVRANIDINGNIL